MTENSKRGEQFRELQDKIKSLEAELIEYQNGEKESILRAGIQLLTRSEERLKRAEIASRSGNWELHLDNLSMSASEGALLLYGLSESEMAYNSLRDIPLPEYRPMLDKAMKDLLSGNKPYNVEFRIKNVATGEILFLHSTAEFDSERRTIFGIIRDITAQKASEELIKRKSRDLAMLLEVTLGLLDSTDRRGVLTDILDGAKKIVSLDTGAVYSVYDDKLLLESTIPPLPEDFPDEFRHALVKNHPHIAASLKSGAPLIVPDILNEDLSPEEEIILRSREMKSLIYIPLKATGQNYGVLILGTIGRLHNFDENDISICRTFSNIATMALENAILISNLKTARDKAEESDKLKTAFLHNISHEIRTPLNAIIGFSGFLSQNDISDEDRQRFIDIINQSNKQLLNTINDIFNISHIEAGQVMLKQNEVYIGKVLNNLYHQFLPETEIKGLSLKIELNNINPDKDIIISDEGKLLQILSNLIGNAIKFTPEGSIILGCTKTENRLKIFVKDTGIGIHETEHSKVFERFYQVDRSISRNYSGAGLGLSISAAYVKLMGGELKLESEPNKGSSFYFEIPVMTAPEVHQKSMGKKMAMESFRVKNATILIAEDEFSNFKLLEYVLKGLGASILHAEDGMEALNICRSDLKIDLVLMDIKMPVLDGYSATREIKKIRPELPVIAQTAYADYGDWQKALEAGCADFIAKPIQKEQLLGILMKYLS
jgi:PAS domain S-box-containing protein